MLTPGGGIRGSVHTSHVRALATNELPAKPLATVDISITFSMTLDVAEESQQMCLTFKREEASLLNFTVEMHVIIRIPYLDVEVDGS